MGPLAMGVSFMICTLLADLLRRHPILSQNLPSLTLRAAQHAQQQDVPVNGIKRMILHLDEGFA